VGAVLSALWLASQRYTHLEHRRNLLLGLVGFGTGLLGVAVSRRFEVALACQVIAGFSMIRYTATTNTLIQLLVDEGYRGRVMGLHTVMFMGTSPIGSLVIGTVAERFGAPMGLAVAGATPLVAAAWLMLSIPQAALRQPATA
jgi:MFS family permease